MGGDDDNSNKHVCQIVDLSTVPVPVLKGPIHGKVQLNNINNAQQGPSQSGPEEENDTNIDE